MHAVTSVWLNGVDPEENREWRSSDAVLAKRVVPLFFDSPVVLVRPSSFLPLLSLDGATYSSST